MINNRVVRLAAAACASASLAACGAAGGSATPTPTPVPWAGAILVNPLPAPSFTLTSSAGAAYDFRKQTQGKVALLYFGYTFCPDACPTAMASIALALRQLPADVRQKVVTIFVTTDPQRDTPDRLRTWLAAFDPGFIGLTGSMDQINKAEDASALPLATAEPIPGASPGAYGVAHAAVILVFTPDGLAHVEWPDGVQTADMARDLQRLATTGFTAT